MIGAPPTLPLVRPARAADVPAIVALLAMLAIGGGASKRDESPGDPIDPAYAVAFAALESDPNSMLMVAELEGRVVGFFQLTVLQHFGFRAGRIAQIESVIVDPNARRRRVGETMMRWAIDEARRRGCFRAQLTTNKVRKEAHAFYEKLGFTPSHVGMKLTLG